MEGEISEMRGRVIAGKVVSGESEPSLRELAFNNNRRAYTFQCECTPDAGETLSPLILDLAKYWID